MVIQKKLNTHGRPVSWTINEELIKEHIPWAKRSPKNLLNEINEMHEKFAFFYLVLSPENPGKEKDLLCPNCQNIIVFARDLICINCQTLFNPFRNPKLAFIGQLPSLLGIAKNGNLGEKKAQISGRPFLKRIHQRILKGEFNLRKYFSSKKNRQGNFDIYFCPVIFCFYPNNWPKSEPIICMERNYFSLLFNKINYNLNDFHAYSYHEEFLKLCNYRTWRTVSLASVLQQRIVPKIIIDLMIADLIEVGKLNTVINRLGTCLHNLYNHIGKGNNRQLFKELYNQYVIL